MTSDLWLVTLFFYSIFILIFVYHDYITCNVAMTVVQLNKIYYTRNYDSLNVEEKALIKLHCMKLADFYYNPFFCYFIFKSSKLLTVEIVRIYTNCNHKYKCNLTPLCEEEKNSLVGNEETGSEINIDLEK